MNYIGLNVPYQNNGSLSDIWGNGGYSGHNSSVMNRDSEGIGSGIGMNLPTMRLGLGLLGSLGSIWGASNMNKLAKDQLNYTKRVTDTNLKNQATAYNTSLEDRIRSRMAVEGRSAEEGDAYLDRNRLTY